MTFVLLVAAAAIIIQFSIYPVEGETSNAGLRRWEVVPEAYTSESEGEQASTGSRIEDAADGSEKIMDSVSGNGLGLTTASFGLVTA